MTPTQADLNLAEVLWQYQCRVDELTPGADSRVILGLGSYDLRVAEHCAQLYLTGYAQTILFSGKSGNWTQDKWANTEAEVFKAHAIAHGVPPEAILTENHATNIGENLRFSRPILELLIPELHTVILVTKPNTTRRAFATCRRQWPEITLRISAPAVKFGDLAVGQTLPSLISELVGDIERLITYPAKGFQIPQQIPPQVYEAYLALRTTGYVEHCQQTC